LHYDSMKKCVFCGESIPADATRCPYCASILGSTVDDDPGRTGDPGGAEPGAGQERQYDPGTGADRQYHTGWQPEHQQGMMQGGRPAPLSNGLKVFLTLLFAMVPAVGQIAGIITAIVFMSSDYGSDRRSFGSALLVANLALFVLSCIGCFLLVLIGTNLY